MRRSLPHGLHCPTRRRARTLSLVAASLVAAAAAGAAAQEPGSIAADRARLFQLTGDSAMIARRDPWTLGSPRLQITLAPSMARVTWNSAIPFSLNDGTQWAGRGLSVALSGGAAIEHRRERSSVTLRIAPALFFSQNRPYQVIPSADSGRSAFASPFHGPDASADVPLRFGDRSFWRVDPGQSALTATYRDAAVGVTASNTAWGPSLRNNIVLSANAPGIPRAFVRTGRPAATRAGLVDAELVAGTLTESKFFDYDDSNDYRAFNGVRVELRPWFDTTLSVGYTRAVIAPIAAPVGGALAHAFDVFVGKRADEMSAFFARWRFLASGLEMYGEWAAAGSPFPVAAAFNGNDAAGYTLGLQWVTPRRAGTWLRLQTELTYLEQSSSGQPPPDFYAGQRAPQGFTQRGQVIGAAIGPGASSHWFAADWVTRRWQAGAFVTRIRWENDALYRQELPTLFRHDVTVAAGVRGVRRLPWLDVATDLTYGYRYNYLFQNGIPEPGGFAFRTVDIRNVTFSTAITPR